MKLPPMPVLLNVVLLGLVLFFGTFSLGMLMSFDSIAVAARNAAAAANLKPTEPVIHDPIDLDKISAELGAWQKELAAEKDRLIRLDQNLLLREQVLAAERDRLNAERTKLDALQKTIQDELIRADQAENQNLTQIADLCDAMKLEDAVAMLRAQADDRLARLLRVMKTKKVAKLLESWSAAHPEDATRIASLPAIMAKVIDGPPPTQARE